jgi:phosphoglycolate phosphatase-like HAD superfamily hydrolase
MKKLLVFDADGVIFDTVMPKLDNLATVLSKEAGVDFKTARERYIDMAGKPYRDVISTILKESNAKGDVEELAKKVIELDRKIPPKAFADAKYALEKLKRIGYKLALSSGASTEETEFKLQKTGLRNYFDVVLGSENRQVPGMDLEHKKGAGHLYVIKEKLRLSEGEMGEAHFIGDGRADMQIARENGMRGIGVQGLFNHEQLKEAGAHDTVKDLLQLVRLLGQGTRQIKLVRRGERIELRPTTNIGGEIATHGGGLLYLAHDRSTGKNFVIAPKRSDNPKIMYPGAISTFSGWSASEPKDITMVREGAEEFVIERDGKPYTTPAVLISNNGVDIRDYLFGKGKPVPAFAGAHYPILYGEDLERRKKGELIDIKSKPRHFDAIGLAYFEVDDISKYKFRDGESRRNDDGSRTPLDRPIMVMDLDEFAREKGLQKPAVFHQTVRKGGARVQETKDFINVDDFSPTVRAVREVMLQRKTDLSKMLERARKAFRGWQELTHGAERPKARDESRAQNEARRLRERRIR